MVSLKEATLAAMAGLEKAIDARLDEADHGRIAQMIDAVRDSRSQIDESVRKREQTVQEPRPRPAYRPR